MKRCIAVLSVFFIFLTGFFVGRYQFSIEEHEPMVERINYEELTHLVESGEDCIVYLHRSSCKICAIVSDSLYLFAGHGLPVYSLNLEDYMGSDAYEDIKAYCNFYYMPCFKYYADGVEKAHLNNPLPDHYFDTDNGQERAEIRKQMESSVIEFITSAASGKETIGEAPMSPVIIPVEAKPSEIQGGD